MPWTAQPLGLNQAGSATKGPRVAWLAVLHAGGPRGLSESALGREEDVTAVKVLETRVGPPGLDRLATLPGREQSRAPLVSPGTDGAGEQEMPDQELSLRDTCKKGWDFLFNRSKVF